MRRGKWKEGRREREEILRKMRGREGEGGGEEDVKRSRMEGSGMEK